MAGRRLTARPGVDKPAVEDLVEEDLEQLVLVRDVGARRDLRIGEELRAVLHADGGPAGPGVQGLGEPAGQYGEDRIWTKVYV